MLQEEKPIKTKLSATNENNLKNVSKSNSAVMKDASKFSTDSNFNIIYNTYSNDNCIHQSLSREERDKKKFSHSVYDKAAIIFEHLNNSKQKKDFKETLPEFQTEYEKRRAYSLAFAAKRYEAVLKDVLLDSSFYANYFKLETLHHSKVMVMLLDFYEHSFRFSDSRRKKISLNNYDCINHISEIQHAFFEHKTKLCSAFARNRIKACALTLEGLLPAEVKERGECGASHPLYMCINTNLATKEKVFKELQISGFTKMNYFEFSSDCDDQEQKRYSAYCIDEEHENLLIFPPEAKDDIFNHHLALNYLIVPQSKPRHIAGELIKAVHSELSLSLQKALLPGDSTLLDKTGDILITHPEAGSLVTHLDTLVAVDRKLFICGCTGKRYDELMKVLKNMNVTNVEVIRDEFKQIHPNDERLCSCKIIVCNPPCSKSGVINPVDYVLYEGSETASILTESVTSSQLHGLVQEQHSTLYHAFQFSLVHSIVYLTDSINEKENQILVDQVLKEQSQKSVENVFVSNVGILNQVIEKFKTDCTAINDETKYLCAMPTVLMDGFFIAVLERKMAEESVRSVIDRAKKSGLLKSNSGEKIKSKQKKAHIKSTASTNFTVKTQHKDGKRSAKSRDNISNGTSSSKPNPNDRQFQF